MTDLSKLSSGTYVLDFTAKHCGPCRQLAPTLHAIEKEYRGAFGLVEVDVDDEPQLAQAFGVRAMPTLVLWRDGKEVGRVVGARPRAFVQGVIDRALRGDVAIACP